MRTLRILALIVPAAMCVPASWGLAIPLTVPERAGCDRVDNPVNGGIPLPQGAYKDVGSFSLVDAAGKPVPAQFVVRERWLKDDSIRFATVHFRTDLRADATAGFTVRDSGGPVAPPVAATVAEGDGAVTVDTGAVKFTVGKGPWHLFDSVDAAGKPALKGPGKVVFQAEYGRTPLADKPDPGNAAPQFHKALPPALGAPTAADAVVRSIAVEEKGPVRVVVLVQGAFQEGGADKLDFQARYYATAGSPAVRVAFTVINRQGKAFDEFVGLRALGFELPLADAGPQYAFALGSSAGKDLEGTVGGPEIVTQLQPTSLEYTVSGKVQATGRCKELLTRRVGWMSLAGKGVVVTAAVRWFWQLHPKGLEATGDGTLKTWLVPFQARKVDVPAGEYSEPLARVDLYTGGAKTHEMLFSFHAPAAAAASDARAWAMGVIEPLFAACEPAWYCQKTFAFDRIYDCRLENYRPEVRELIRQYETAADFSFTTVLAYMSGKQRKDVKVETFFPITATGPDGKPADTTYVSAQRCEEYGWLNFGAHAEYKDYCTENDALNSRWDGNYYDFPRACLVRFVRSGMWQYFDEAQAAATHLADIDICHRHPTNQQLNGIEHVCPNRGQFRQFWGIEPFGVSGNVDSAKSQSLYELYCLTGDGWYRDVGLLSGDYLSVHGGSALRAKGNRITGLFMAYRQTRDEKYRKVWQEQSEATSAFGIDRGGQKAWDQFWMYGLVTEGLYNYYHATGDLNAARADVFAAESMMYCDVNKTMGRSQRSQYNGLAGFSLPAAGYAYELTGDGKFLRYGLERLKLAAANKMNRSKTFAQAFRISPQFLTYLANDYQPPKPVVGEKQAADPAEPIIKQFAAEQAAGAKG